MVLLMNMCNTIMYCKLRLCEPHALNARIEVNDNIEREKERREDRKKKHDGPVSLLGFLGNQDIGMCVYLSYTYIHANMNCTIIHVTFVYLNMQIPISSHQFSSLASL